MSNRPKLKGTAPLSFGQCDADSCLGLGVYHPEILVDHDAGNNIQNPLRVQLTVTEKNGRTRLMRVCDMHMHFPIAAYAAKVNWGFLQNIVGSAGAIDIQRNCNRLFMQFSYTVNGKESLISSPHNGEILRGKVVTDYGVIHDDKKADG